MPDQHDLPEEAVAAACAAHEAVVESILDRGMEGRDANADTRSILRPAAPAIRAAAVEEVERERDEAHSSAEHWRERAEKAERERDSAVEEERERLEKFANELTELWCAPLSPEEKLIRAKEATARFLAALDQGADRG